MILPCIWVLILVQAWQYTLASMDSAGVRQLVELLQAQEACLFRQEDFQTAMASHLGPTDPSDSASHSHYSSGTDSIDRRRQDVGATSQIFRRVGQCKTFLTDCSIQLRPHDFSTNRSKIACL